ncbi:MAG: hypothetical protein HC897_16110, partial [Thermoanaerobaculia bacterium]|nr:hypothetical protein [Thermoanaerobaculia bacterium]
MGILLGPASVERIAAMLRSPASRPQSFTRTRVRSPEGMPTLTSSTLDRRELEGLHELARELLRLDDYDHMLDAVVGRALETLRADRGFLVLERGEGLDFKVVRNWSRAELEGAASALALDL